MRMLIRRLAANDPASGRVVQSAGLLPWPVLSLPFSLRQKSRLRSELPDGTPVAILLERGLLLRHGDVLEAEDGFRVQIHAAFEPVSEVRAHQIQDLLRAAYHLGNRHVELQVGPDVLRYLRDHVLDDMVRGLGLQVESRLERFEPEAGAYAGTGHAHHHPHAHEHPHAHVHSHAHIHPHRHPPVHGHSYTHVHPHEEGSFRTLPSPPAEPEK